MTNNTSLKKNLSSIQVLKTLQTLMEDNYTMVDLIKKLNEDEPTPVFNHSVVSKYINTCRYIGVDIPKIHNKYFVAKLPFGLDLTSRDLELIKMLQEKSIDTMPKRTTIVFGRFLENLSKYSNRELVRVEEKSPQKSFESFEKAIANKRKVRLMFKNREEIDCIPLCILEEKGKEYFSILHMDKNRLIATERVSGLEILEERFVQTFSGQVVVFQLRGDMAKRYTPREHEQVVNKDSTSITISNKGENKELLFRRLLRYDSCCEILHPKHYRAEMRRILDEILENYGV